MDVVDKVSFVNKISMLMKATSDDDNPIPGYLYDDVNKISYESPGYCISLLEFLVSQLEKRSYHTKLKVLKLMAYVVENGQQDFRHGLRRQATGIKEATKFSGPPDPLHGNVPYLMVRQTAQSLSEVLFDAERKMESQTDQKKSHPSNSASTGMGNIQGKGKMEGFGNSPQHQPKTTGQLLRDSLGNFLDKLTESPQSNQTFLTDAHKVTSNFAPVKLDQKTEIDILTENFTDSLPRVTVPQHVPGKAGGGWDDDESQQHHLSSSYISTNKDNNTSNTEFPEDRLDSGEYSLPDWSEEDQLVSEMIQNPRQIPSRTDLETFNTKCSSLNCDKILELINHHLQTDAPRHSQLMCLFMLEWLCRTDFINLNLMASLSKDNLLNIYNSISSKNDKESNADHTDEMLIKSKTRKIIRTLEKLTSHKNILPMTQKSVKSPSNDTEPLKETTSSMNPLDNLLLETSLPQVTLPNIYSSPEGEEKENTLAGSMTKSVFDFIRMEEEKFDAEKSAKSLPEVTSPSGMKQCSPHSPSLSLYSKIDTEFSDASSQPSAGSEFSLLNDDSLETNEN